MHRFQSARSSNSTKNCHNQRMTQCLRNLQHCRNKSTSKDTIEIPYSIARQRNRNQFQGSACTNTRTNTIYLDQRPLWRQFLLEDLLLMTFRVSLKQVLELEHCLLQEQQQHCLQQEQQQHCLKQEQQLQCYLLEQRHYCCLLQVLERQPMDSKQVLH